MARVFYELMTTGQFDPDSPPHMNAGRPLEGAWKTGEPGVFAWEESI